MTPEEKQAMQAHVEAIAAILYKDSENRDPERLKTLEGIEVEVRQQVLKHVSPEIGIFLWQQGQVQQREEADKSKAVSGN